jgi:hypothetical protein
MWPAGLKKSFGGFCGATFIIGSGLGSLETAANPYMASKQWIVFMIVALISDLSDGTTEIR